MAIPNSEGLRLQDWLRVIAPECYCANSFLSGLIESLDQRVRWQAAVDTVCRLLCSGLISPCGVEVSSDQCVEVYVAYVSRLAKFDPFSAPINPAWIEWDLCGTSLCRSMIEEHGISQLHAGEISESFLVELDSLFTKAGVPWNTSPLIPIED